MSTYHTSMPLEFCLAKVEEIAATTVRQQAIAVDGEARWPRESLQALLAAGLGGLVVPARFGGAGHGLDGLAQVCEIIGRECASTAICFGMHCVGSSVIAAQATDDQVERFLKPICEGRHLTTLALSEPGTGAHFYFPQTRARQMPDGNLALNGTKTFVTNGSHADSYVVSVDESESDSGAGAMSCLVVPADSPGMTWGETWAGFGMRGNQSCRLALEDVRVPAANLLGRHGDQIWYVFNVVAPYFLIAMAGSYLGVANAALEHAIAHLRGREHAHNRSRLSEASVLQHRLGDLVGRRERTRALVHHAARRFDAGQPDAASLVMLAKAEVADTVVGTVNEAMTLMGGIAYAENSAMQRLLRDARAAHVMAPTTDLLRIWVGRTALGEPLLAE